MTTEKILWDALDHQQTIWIKLAETNPGLSSIAKEAITDLAKLKAELDHKDQIKTAFSDEHNP